MLVLESGSLKKMRAVSQAFSQAVSQAVPRGFLRDFRGSCKVAGVLARSLGFHQISRGFLRVPGWPRRFWGVLGPEKVHKGSNFLGMWTFARAMSHFA